MNVGRLISILEMCDENDEVTFIFDSDERFSTDIGEGLFEVSQLNVTGLKINGRIPLTNGMTHKVITGDEPSIFK